jgi:hypothetical protein
MSTTEATESTTKNKKRAFDFGRSNLWSIDPDDICIIGGKDLPKDEQGPLDTEADESHPLYDGPRLAVALSPEFVNSVFTVGVKVAVGITKIDDHATVVFGRTRIRAARVANKRRLAQGLPLLKVNCVMERDTTAIGLAGTMIVENEGRRDDGPTAKVEKLKRYMAMGVSLEDAMIRFHQPTSVGQSWLNYEDHATTKTKKAVESGKISLTAAITLVRIKDPEEQNTALAELLTTAGNGKVTQREVKLAVKGNKPKSIVGIHDKKTQMRFLEMVQSKSHANATEKTLAYWDGIEQAFKIMMGDDDVDQKLVKMLDDVRAQMKTEKAEKGKKAPKAKAA